jgi:hypothetical protein
VVEALWVGNAQLAADSSSPLTPGILRSTIR